MILAGGLGGGGAAQVAWDTTEGEPPPRPPHTLIVIPSSVRFPAGETAVRETKEGRGI